MLFYKRVEPEEENGKDFSFDVSPDLLEVRISRSVVISRSIACETQICLSVDLARQHAVPPG